MQASNAAQSKINIEIKKSFPGYNDKALQLLASDISASAKVDYHRKLTGHLSRALSRICQHPKQGITEVGRSSCTFHGTNLEALLAVMESDKSAVVDRSADGKSIRVEIISERGLSRAVPSFKGTTITMQPGYGMGDTRADVLRTSYDAVLLRAFPGKGANDKVSLL